MVPLRLPARPPLPFSWLDVSRHFRALRLGRCTFLLHGATLSDAPCGRQRPACRLARRAAPRMVADCLRRAVDGDSYRRSRLFAACDAGRPHGISRLEETFQDSLSISPGDWL